MLEGIEFADGMFDRAVSIEVEPPEPRAFNDAERDISNLSG